MWFEFITNTECNWNCEYCTFDRIPNHKMNISVLQKHQYIFDMMKIIRENMDVEVVCEGGEIGFMDNPTLEALFKKIDQKVIINTNGMFFESNRESLYPYIDKVFYHIAQDAKTLFKVKTLDVPFDVVYGLVNDSAEESKEFIEYNSHIKIDYNEYEFINIPPKEQKNYELHRKACWNCNPFTVIDLAREVILPCTARGAHVSIPLTQKNLWGLLCSYTKSDQVNEMCQTCYRMCMTQDWKEVIQRKAKLKQIL